MTNKVYDFNQLPPREGTHCVKWDMRENYFGKADLLPLWVADMDFETPDFILNKLQERLQHPVLGYTVRSEEFNQAFITWANRRYGWQVKKEWMSFSPGVVSAVTMAVQGFTEPGDEVITQPPVYFPFFQCVEGTGRSLLYNPLKEVNGRLCMDFEQLKSIISPRTRMIIISNPHNPGGSVWTPEELVQLGDICAKHQIMVVSDEIHSDLVFAPYRHTPFAQVVPQEKVKSITCMAASKTFNLAGLSTSLVIAPNPEVLEKYNKLLMVSHINMGNIFGSLATQTAYAEGWDWLEQLLGYLKENRDFLAQYVQDRLSPLRVLIPEATYLAWVDFSGLRMSQDRLNHWLIHEAGVAMNSGTLFGPGGDGFIRINFACPKAILLEALQRIEKVLPKK